MSKQVMKSNSWIILRDLLEREGVARQHLNSYNEFVLNGMQNIIDEISEIEVETVSTPYKIKFGRITLGTPRVVEIDGSVTRTARPGPGRVNRTTFSGEGRIPIKAAALRLEQAAQWLDQLDRISGRCVSQRRPRTSTTPPGRRRWAPTRSRPDRACPAPKIAPFPPSPARRLENLDASLADDFSFAFRIGHSFEPAQEQGRGVLILELDAEAAAETAPPAPRPRAANHC